MAQIEQRAELNYLHMAPRKVRLIANTMKGLSVNEAEAQLMLRPQRASRPLLKLLRSAMANATNNKKMNVTNLRVASIQVDSGPMLKRMLPRAMGRATPIQKKTSHVTLILREGVVSAPPRFQIAPPVKKEKKPEKQKARKPKSSEGIAAEKTKQDPGFFRKIFRRKSV